MRDLSLHLMDIMQNSISAHATEITVSVYADSVSGDLVLSVVDNGTGMEEELLKHVTDPFTTTRTTRKVGLGIPLLKDSAEMAGGRMNIKSSKGKGTSLEASFKIRHIDRIPLGDIAETIVSLIVAEPDIDYKLYLSSGCREFRFDTAEIRERLGEVPMGQYEVTMWMKEYINEGITNVFGGVLDEIIS